MRADLPAFKTRGLYLGREGHSQKPRKLCECSIRPTRRFFFCSKKSVFIVFQNKKKKTSKCCNTTSPLQRAWSQTNHGNSTPSRKWLEKQFLPSKKMRDGQFLQQQFESSRKTPLPTCCLENLNNSFSQSRVKFKAPEWLAQKQKGRSSRPQS